MFVLACPVIGSNVLRWPGDVVSIDHPRPGEIEVLLECACGAHALLRTGSARGGRDEGHHGVAVDAPSPRVATT